MCKQITLLVLLGACLTQVGVVSAQTLVNEHPVCRFDGVEFISDFPMGRISTCEKGGKKSYRLTVSPEKAGTKGNPWYAFKVVSDKPRKIAVTIKYDGAKHRYDPKTSTDGLRWEPMPTRAFKLQSNGEKLRIKLSVGPQPQWVAGQEIIHNGHYKSWVSQMAAKSFVKGFVIGESPQGRPLYKLETSGGKEGTVVLFGRMRAPQVTGALTMLPFVQTLFSDTPLANNFRSKFNVLVIPNMNPDGVEHGNWQYNARGVDLDRNWRRLSQPEVKAVHRDLSRLQDADSARPAFFVNFISAKSTLFYTVTDEMEAAHGQAFTGKWLAAIEKRLPQFKVNRRPSGSLRTKNAKNYMHETFGIPSVNFAMADGMDRKAIPIVASLSAAEMMRILLDSIK